MSDKSFSALRSIALQSLKKVVPIRIDFDPAKDTDIIKQYESCGLQDKLFTRVLDFETRLLVQQKLDEIADPKTQTINFGLNRDIGLIGKLISDGIVDSAGVRVFSEEDVHELSGVYSSLIFGLCWQVLYSNDFFPKEQQETAKNSDGTEISEN